MTRGGVAAAGVGKTALAAAVVGEAAVRQRYGNEVYWIHVGSKKGPELITAMVRCLTAAHPPSPAQAAASSCAARVCCILRTGGARLLSSTAPESGFLLRKELASGRRSFPLRRCLIGKAVCRDLTGVLRSELCMQPTSLESRESKV